MSGISNSSDDHPLENDVTDDRLEWYLGLLPGLVLANEHRRDGLELAEEHDDKDARRDGLELTEEYIDDTDVRRDGLEHEEVVDVRRVDPGLDWRLAFPLSSPLYEAFRSFPMQGVFSVSLCASTIDVKACTLDVLFRKDKRHRNQRIASPSKWVKPD